jgi:ficolin
MACHSSNLNGKYLNGPHTSYADGVEWYSWTGHYESLARTEMKVREN